MTREIMELARMRDMVRGGTACELRIGAGLTLAEVGRSIGVHPSTVFYWERGRTPRGKPAVRYARLLADLESLQKVTT